MTPSETASTLRQFNEWRRGDYEPSEQPEPPNPYEVGLAIDAAVEMIDRLEAAEKARDDVAQQLVQAELGKRKLDAECDALRARIEAMERQEQVAWMGRGPRDGRIEFSVHKPSPSVMRDFNMTPLYALPGAKGE